MVGRRTRVCQFTPSLWNGGAEERMARILGGMDRGRFELSWLGFGGAREALVGRAGQDVAVVPVPRDPTAGIELALIPQLAGVLRRLRPDVLHIHNWSTSAYGIAAGRLAGVPTILYESAGRESPDGPPPRRRRMMRAMMPQLRAFTTVCRFLGAELEAHWGAPPARVRVMPTGVDLEHLARGRARRHELRRALGIPPGARVVGSLSVLRPVKRVGDLVAAVGRLAAARPDLYLVVAGHPLQISLEELAAQGRELGLGSRLILPGLIEDPASVIGAYDLFVSSSMFEGASNAIIEAMASGLPIVGTAVGGTPELVTPEDNGLLIAPGDVDGLAAAIARIIDDPALGARMGERGHERARREHSEAHMVAAYETLYAELAATAAAQITSVARAAESLQALVTS